MVVFLKTFENSFGNDMLRSPGFSDWSFGYRRRASKGGKAVDSLWPGTS